jgi:hypothetical protein
MLVSTGPFAMLRSDTEIENFAAILPRVNTEQLAHAQHLPLQVTTDGLGTIVNCDCCDTYRINNI